MSESSLAIPHLPQTAPVELDAGQIDEFAAFLRELVVAAGPSTLAYFRKPITITNKLSAQGGAYDPVTQADQDAETCIRTLISKRYPEHGVFGEEHGFEAGT